MSTENRTIHTSLVAPRSIYWFLNSCIDKWQDHINSFKLPEVTDVNLIPWEMPLAPRF